MSFANEKIVETKICKQCSQDFNITDMDLEFYEKVSPVFNGQKYFIPSPKLCPECRRQRRFAFRNERNLFKGKSALSGKNIISNFEESSGFTVYSLDEWYSDVWSASDYGIEYDFDKNFFPQFQSLLKSVPIQNLFISGNNENSEYGNHAGNLKDSYMIFASWGGEKSYYCYRLIDCSNCVDAFGINQSENSYEIIHSSNLYNCFYCINTTSSDHSYLLQNCDSCSYCYGCIGLKNKKYYIYNVEYSQEEYNKRLEELLKNEKLSWKQLKNIPVKNKIYPGNTYTGSQNVLGDNLINCSNISNGFFLSDIHNAKYVENAGIESGDVYDSYGFGANFYLGYETIDTGLNGYMNVSTGIVHECSHTYYSFNCYQSQYLFGCVGMRNQKYCIFNKQYSKDEYHILVPKIIEHMKTTGEWGEFFSTDISPYSYNHSVAQEYFPMKKNEALKKGFNWSDYEAPLPKVDKIIPANKLPENISDIPDDILNWAIECEITKKPFRIIPQELEFYRKHNLPIPKRHPDQRHLDRMNIRNSSQLFKRDCDKCGVEMDTTYTPDRKEIVYCEECYNREVY